MLISDLPELKKRIDVDLTINEGNVLKKSLDQPILYHKYLDLFMAEMRQLKRLAAEKDKIYGVLYEKYKFNHNQVLDTKGEIEAWIRVDAQYLKIITDFNDQEVVCKYLENVVDCVSRLSFSIKNFVEYKKFLSGS